MAKSLDVVGKISVSVIKRLLDEFTMLDFHRKYIITVVVYRDKMAQKCNCPNTKVGIYDMIAKLEDTGER